MQGVNVIYSSALIKTKLNKTKAKIGPDEAQGELGINDLKTNGKCLSIVLTTRIKLMED